MYRSITAKFRTLQCRSYRFFRPFFSIFIPFIHLFINYKDISLPIDYLFLSFNVSFQFVFHQESILLSFQRLHQLLQILILPKHSTFYCLDHLLCFFDCFFFNLSLFNLFFSFKNFSHCKNFLLELWPFQHRQLPVQKL